tara:strand:- start:1998 stop:4052 length:2055 start_codon:yes stop_codon:yes gene_type:complete
MISNSIGGWGSIINKPGNLKGRTIEYLDINLYKQHYYGFLEAQQMYISNMASMIHRKQFFGKGDGTKDDIGSAVEQWISQRTELGGKQILDPVLPVARQQEIVDILRSIYNQQSSYGWIVPYKNIIYGALMGSVKSAITQVGDLCWTWSAVGLPRTTQALLKTLIRQNILTKEDIGISDIAYEFRTTAKTGKMLNLIFDAVGLTGMDTLGKETFIEAVYSKYQRTAKKITEGKNFYVQDEFKKMEFYTSLLETFGSQEAADLVLKDLAEGKMSDDIKFLMFCELSNIQPISHAEMPQKYLDMPNGRIAYQLKTFTIKQFDIYRREGKLKLDRAIRMIDDGRKARDEGRETNNPELEAEGNQLIKDGKKTYAQQLKKFIHLLFAFWATNMAADGMKDYITGREIDWDDYMVDGLLRMVGIGKWIAWENRRMGIEFEDNPVGFISGIFLQLGKQFAPFGTGLAVAERPLRDTEKVSKIISGELDWKGAYFESTSLAPAVDLYTLSAGFIDKYFGTDAARKIPAGKMYYWWFGKGKEGGLNRKVKKITDNSKDGIGAYEDFDNILDVEEDLNQKLSELEAMHSINITKRRDKIKLFYNNLLKEFEERKAGKEGSAIGETYSEEDRDMYDKILQRMVDLELMSVSAAENRKKNIYTRYKETKEEKAEKKKLKGENFEEIYEKYKDEEY